MKKYIKSSEEDKSTKYENAIQEWMNKIKKDIKDDNGYGFDNSYKVFMDAVNDFKNDHDKVKLSYSHGPRELEANLELIRDHTETALYVLHNYINYLETVEG